MSRLFKKFQQDVMGILFLAGAAFLGLALASFQPTDPSLNSIGNGLKVSNYCGYVGSFLSDGLYQLFGISAWLVALAFARMGWLSLKGGAFNIKDLRLIWGSLLILTLSSLISVYWPDAKIFQQQIYIGGIIGMSLAHGLVKVFNPVGVQVVLWSLAAILVVFFSEKTVQELTETPTGALKRIFKFRWPRWQLFAKEKRSKKETRSEVAELEEQAPKTVSLFTKPDKKESAAEVVLETPQQTELFIPSQNEEKPVARRKVVLKTVVPQRVENWDLPKLSLMEDPPNTRIRIEEKEIKRKAELLKDKLAQFSVTGEVVAARPGPAVTMFEFKPDANVKLSKITELADDLSLALSSESLRIIAPIPGRDVVGIETSNSQRETVYLKDMLADENFWKEDIKLPIALGKQANGEPRIVDLRKMPHLMVAGTTGSGKSVFIVSTIMGLIYKHSPKTLKLIMVDPKQVDLAAFDKVPHLAMPIVTDTKQAVSALKWAVREMEKRYKSMSKFGARGLEQFNDNVSQLGRDQIEEHEKINQELEQTPGKKGDQYYFAPLPYVVIVIEEFGDLMAVDKANVENSIVRLAQKARACGIHLILAMQSPRKEVVTGLIKTNIPGRISFKVSSAMDSRIILDDTGAERLLANGDMLFRNPGGSNLIRHHGPFLKDSEIFGIAKFWANQGEPEYNVSAMKALEAPSNEMGDGADFDDSEEESDPMYDQILNWISTQKTVSASGIQTRFQLGYPRASRLIQNFEARGIVGPASGSKPRQVLISNLNDLGT